MSLFLFLQYIYVQLHDEVALRHMRIQSRVVGGAVRLCWRWVGGAWVKRGGVWTRKSPPLSVPSSVKWTRAAAMGFHSHVCADLRRTKTQFMTLSSPLILIYWCLLVAVKKHFKILKGSLRVVCVWGFDLGVMWTHSLRSKEDRTTETDDAAIAAEPIQGCSTRPTGINTPDNKTTTRL